MAIEKHTVDESSGAAIYAESANLNYFVKTEITPDSVEGVVTKTKNIPSRSVRRYVGDPNPYTIGPVSGARYVYDPGRRNGSATPGKEMIMDDGTERRSFTYVGSWVDVHAFFLGNLAKDATVYSEGDGSPMKATGGEAVQAKAKR